jgi:choice-of-anchor A domain-containing protein
MKAQVALCLVIVGLCASWASAQSCPASFFGSAASGYNVFLLGGGSGNYTFDLINGDTEGSVAVNGNFRATNFGVGTRLGSCNASTPTLVVGGEGSSVSFSGGLQCGSLFAEESAQLISLPGFANGELVQGSVLDNTGADSPATNYTPPFYYIEKLHPLTACFDF